MPGLTHDTQTGEVRSLVECFRDGFAITRGDDKLPPKRRQKAEGGMKNAFDDRLHPGPSAVRWSEGEHCSKAVRRIVVRLARVRRIARLNAARTSQCDVPAN